MAVLTFLQIAMLEMQKLLVALPRRFDFELLNEWTMQNHSKVTKRVSVPSASLLVLCAKDTDRPTMVKIIHCLTQPRPGQQPSRHIFFHAFIW